MTAGLVRRTKNTELAAKIHEAELDYLMSRESGEERWLDDDEHELAKLGMQTSYDVRHNFVGGR